MQKDLGTSSWEEQQKELKSEKETLAGLGEGGGPGRGTRGIEGQKERLWVCVGRRRERREKKDGSQLGSQRAWALNNSNKQQNAETPDLPNPRRHKTSARWPDSDTNQVAGKANLSHFIPAPAPNPSFIS